MSLWKKRGKSDESLTTFKFDFTGKTRTVSDPRPGVPDTIYTLNPYGATTKIQAPEGQTSMNRWGIETCGAARPTPRRSNIRRAMLSTVSRRSSSTRSTGLVPFVRMGWGQWAISTRMA